MNQLNTLPLRSNHSVYRFAYYVDGRNDRERLPHQLRDADAAMFILPIFTRCGFDFAGPLWNPPADEQYIGGSRGAGMPVGDGDIVLLTTRPPMDDLEQGDRSCIRPSNTPLERIVFNTVRRHLRRCARSNVIVETYYAAKFPAIGLLQHLWLRQTHGAAIQRFRSLNGEWQTPEPHRPRSVAFLLCERLWDGGPRLVASFGFSGPETLLWNYFVATHHPDLIESDTFVMAEIQSPRKMPQYCESMKEFASHYSIRLLAHEVRASS